MAFPGLYFHYPFYFYAAPLSLPHMNPEEANVNGYTVPKNSILIANLWSSNMDPKHWDQPGEFRPERFLGEDGKLKKNAALVPFSIGMSYYPGELWVQIYVFCRFKKKDGLLAILRPFQLYLIISGRCECANERLSAMEPREEENKMTELLPLKVYSILKSRPRDYKKNTCSTQLSMNFFLINVKMPTIIAILTFMSRKNSILRLSEPEIAEFLDIFILTSI